MQEMIPNQNNDAIKNFGCSPVMKTDFIFECWMSHAPSQNLVDNYLVIDRLTNPGRTLERIHPVQEQCERSACQ